MSKDHKYALLGVVLGAAIAKGLPEWNATVDSHQRDPASPHATWSRWSWMLLAVIVLFLVFHPGND